MEESDHTSPPEDQSQPTEGSQKDPQSKEAVERAYKAATGKDLKEVKPPQPKQIGMKLIPLWNQRQVKIAFTEKVNYLDLEPENAEKFGAAMIELAQQIKMLPKQGHIIGADK